MEYRFPLLGFPGETNEPDGDIVYRCFFEKARVALWKQHKAYGGYAVNLYYLGRTDSTETHVADRICYNQQPIPVADAFEAQLAINYLLQKYLPTEVTDDFSNAEEQDAASNSAGEACSV